MIHLGERECSIQRRHQKVIEECPSPLVLKKPELRNAIGEASLKIARAAHYYNAGTLEFLSDQDGQFYFLEMNTRLQVEHPVTELVTGRDLVHWQLRIASGERLTLRQEDIEWRGSAIECRVYAEDPENGFFPCPGDIAQYAEPSGPGVRVDGGVYAGWTVPIDYDPLLAKLVVWAESRESAAARMRRAVSEYHVSGLTTNLDLFSQLMSDPEFQRGNLHTGFLDEFMKRRAPQERDNSPLVAALLAAADSESAKPRNSHSAHSAWCSAGQRGLQQ
jgi:acetyl-CoA carboxylase biotin carboxylase subunit